MFDIVKLKAKFKQLSISLEKPINTKLSAKNIYNLIIEKLEYLNLDLIDFLADDEINKSIINGINLSLLSQELMAISDSLLVLSIIQMNFIIVYDFSARSAEKSYTKKNVSTALPKAQKVA